MKKSIYNLFDKLPIEVQQIIDSFWSWKNFYTDNIIYHLNHDLSIDHYLSEVIDKEVLVNPNLLRKQKNIIHYQRSNIYFLNNKEYIYELNEKIKNVVNDKALLKFYKNKYEWMCIINTSYYDKTDILEEIKYYSYMILYFNVLRNFHISYSLKNSFTCKELQKNPYYIDPVVLFI